MPTPENKGNLITRRAFSERDGVELSDARMKVLRHVVNKAMSTAYQMTEECGEYGSGRPSPLHMLCELIREAHDLDAKDGLDFSTAQELAEYPLTFLRLLRGQIGLTGDFVCKLNYLVKTAGDAMYSLKGRDLPHLSPGELKAFADYMIGVAGLAAALQAMADDQAQRLNYPGAPCQRERIVREAGAGLE